ncbi:NAD(P)H-hydrate dehydratase [Antarcticibacterium flavum]|uniref:Bifunctional NAD(P)H-hydrate repair enzyme n=1 Tax=Antarcticibacterium flavum TaxID=2058175 RepID=A0A5B7WZU9_9FLAO|nr:MULTISPECIES: NAD(P)H-hydrate dehydratase [Antarcticibacterium]MCM4160287.1 bifunctional ADP-dependent NAD(P)H-hydrate dehydratase/NAD(P)H-hydrate epimerase [Antarcticibacterium sp. W02-3]QCY67938.1 NAD(P)H-hydrate dehydratase [Antarcticibacterium flavum]
MNIYDVRYLAEADEKTIERQEITSTDLMERAATEAFKEIISRLEPGPVPIKVFAGIGNNGGDGLVIARLLLGEGYNVEVFIVDYSRNRSKDFLINYNKLKELGRPWPVSIKSEDEIPEIAETDIVIDAIFGIGLNRPAEGWVASLISKINLSSALVIAIDMPSGLFADKMPKTGHDIIKAHLTLTFQSPKLVFYLPQTGSYAGEVEVLDIGLDQDFLSSLPVRAKLIDHIQILDMYRPRDKFSHKGTYGHSLIIGGSYGKIGSISLTARAALRSGAGMVSIYAPSCGYEILQTVLPEAMVIMDEGDKEIMNIKYDLKPEVVCFGMGAGTSGTTTGAFRNLLEGIKFPMVIDADGLNMLSKNKEFLKLLPPQSVLTPHPRELQRLIGDWEDDLDKLDKAMEFLNKYSLVMVLKDAHTIILSGNEMYINDTGNPGMATAGAGDVLAGVITAFISQGYSPLEAAIIGTWLHGRAGDLAANELSYEGMIAGDITNYIGKAILELFKNDEDSS